MELSHLVEALRAEALDAALTDDGQIVVNLPSSRDQLILGPSRGGSEPRLFWQRRTFLGTRTNECGYLEWTAAPEPVVGAILGYARAPGLTGPQYGPVLDALRSNGLDAAIVTTSGGCHLICVHLADGTQLIVGAPESLPPQLSQVTGWLVRHRGPGNRSTVVYHSTPAPVSVSSSASASASASQDRDAGAPTGGPDIHLMAKHVARYVTEAGLRHDGHRPLTTPAPEQEVTARSLALLVGELAQLPRHQKELDNSGGALITITERDGTDTRTTEIPAGLVSRMHSVLFSMLTVMRPYDE
ncbi:hypothetical protein [Streptomyces sp. NBC_00986]|uniref:hypothetical protein n=1 Tax=Streptomyces sp. NBC_00986 TaxID=2903702 RepID=UPI00386C9DDB|nr:hypothetical protein OG504_37440 [Streptomyces sp. NBC_00986]